METARVILEMGMGNDLHGKDYTKAALRAVKDAMHHSSLHFLKSLDVDRKSIIIHVKIGVQDPLSVNQSEIKKIIPFENAQIHIEEGGLDVVDTEINDTLVIASAAVEVMLPTTKA
tara:strand:- start:473 stop:820 length:348 start_codon:yes stop_codon:yes gene_type:complete